MINNIDISSAMSIQLEAIFNKLPDLPGFSEGIRRAPKRNFILSQKETELALKNALRYIPEKWHQKLAPEFLNELLLHGRIYGYRFRPEGRIFGRPIDQYQGNCLEGMSLQELASIARDQVKVKLTEGSKKTNSCIPQTGRTMVKERKSGHRRA